MGKLSKAFEKSSNSSASGATRQKPEPAPGKKQTEEKAVRSKVIFPDLDAGYAREFWDSRLQLSTDPKSGYFESFRRLRASIVYPSSGRRPRTLLVTSAAPHEGKGFVCANLGLALSQGMEHHAMMVDCDFRHPTLAGLFGHSNETGLTDYLQDEAELSLLIRKTGQSKLSLLPSGRPPRNPAELLSSSRMARLIDEMAERYPDRIVLFDSPPDVIASETSVLAQNIDGVILVVRYGASRKADVKRFVENVGREKIYGVVFNAFPEDTMESFLNRKMGYGYGYYKYSYGGY
ncbi:MAG: CpsD/CapB family tyrosine-protein kinase [Desulfobacteraceae bacterium]|nr:CpsD/CapB family tyrosine-protein kinase [Desulfobacteraceae bacterium]